MSATIAYDSAHVERTKHVEKILSAPNIEEAVATELARLERTNGHLIRDTLVLSLWSSIAGRITDRRVSLAKRINPDLSWGVLSGYHGLSPEEFLGVNIAVATYTKREQDALDYLRRYLSPHQY